tara:strand:- start:1196 stop:1774 length:579 start_codon:yes stop_codon:yes gene_type:complete
MINIKKIGLETVLSIIILFVIGTVSKNLNKRKSSVKNDANTKANIFELAQLKMEVFNKLKLQYVLTIAASMFLVNIITKISWYSSISDLLWNLGFKYLYFNKKWLLEGVTYGMYTYNIIKIMEKYFLNKFKDSLQNDDINMDMNINTTGYYHWFLNNNAEKSQMFVLQMIIGILTVLSSKIILPMILGNDDE